MVLFVVSLQVEVKCAQGLTEIILMNQHTDQFFLTTDEWIEFQLQIHFMMREMRNSAIPQSDPVALPDDTTIRAYKWQIHSAESFIEHATSIIPEDGLTSTFEYFNYSDCRNDAHGYEIRLKVMHRVETTVGIFREDYESLSRGDLIKLCISFTASRDIDNVRKMNQFNVCTPVEMLQSGIVKVKYAYILQMYSYLLQALSQPEDNSSFQFTRHAVEVFSPDLIASSLENRNRDFDRLLLNFVEDC